MFIISYKINKQKIFMIIAIFFILAIILGVSYKLFYKNSIKAVNQPTQTVDFEKEKEIAKKFIESFGWNVEPNVTETEKFQIPKEFDTLYKKYNQYQKDVGLDISSCKGKNVNRYTFKVLNYNNPKDFKNQQVYADVLLCEGKVIAGDLKTNELNGFMVSLKNHTFKDITGIDEWMFR